MKLKFFISFTILLFNICFAQTKYASLVADYNKNKNFNGSVLVASNGKIDYLNGIGIANRQNQSLINTSTKFKIASITKTFTAVMILKLYEEGKLDLNANIGKYLPEYKGQAKNKVTIHNLLTYSSGIPNCEGSTGIDEYQKPISVEKFIDNYCSGNLEFEPGKQFNYNNGDYILLGRIIEKITGQSFANNIEAFILNPLQMKNTNMLHTKDIISNLAATYNFDDSTKQFYNDDPMYIENYYAAGAMYSTVEDLLKFDQALFTYKLLNKKTVNLMLTPYPELYGVAYGFWVTDSKIGDHTFKVANRQGSIWGANTNWFHIIDQNKTIIIFSNTNATNLGEFASELALIATEQKVEIPKH